VVIPDKRGENWFISLRRKGVCIGIIKKAELVIIFINNPIINNIIGIFKAYCTRVGSGPFPTELKDNVGEHMGRVGNEFGATTGRARRCGWIDLPALRYAINVNGVTQLMMMKSDVLSGLKKIKVCTHYLNKHE